VCILYMSSGIYMIKKVEKTRIFSISYALGRLRQKKRRRRRIKTCYRSRIIFVEICLKLIMKRVCVFQLGLKIQSWLLYPRNIIDLMLLCSFLFLWVSNIIQYLTIIPARAISFNHLRIACYRTWINARSNLM
jgi:hypothetical protein